MLEAEFIQRCELSQCRAACCLHGAWIDQVEIEDILNHADLIAPHMPDNAQEPREWFDGRNEKDAFSISGEVGHTQVVSDPEHYGGTTCIFLRTDYKCALQVAANAAQLHPWRFKPFYCILHPLDLATEGRITLDRTDLLLDEPGSCLRPAGTPIPLVETFEEELRYLLGDKKLQKLKFRG
jgi:hypothetical protein